MKNIEKVEAYKTSNGEIFDNEYAAIKKQTEINAKEAIDNICEKLMTYGMDKYDVASIIFEHREEFINACKGIIEK